MTSVGSALLQENGPAKLPQRIPSNCADSDLPKDSNAEVLRSRIVSADLAAIIMYLPDASHEGESKSCPAMARPKDGESF